MFRGIHFENSEDLEHVGRYFFVSMFSCSWPHHDHFCHVLTVQTLEVESGIWEFEDCGIRKVKLNHSWADFSEEMQPKNDVVSFRGGGACVLKSSLLAASP